MRYLGILLNLFATPTWVDHELDNRNITAGSEQYQTRCAVCQGVNLEGQPNWQSPNDLAKTKKFNGKTKIPGDYFNHLDLPVTGRIKFNIVGI